MQISRDVIQLREFEFQLRGECMSSNIDISVVIPTFRREKVLLDTIKYLLDLNPAPDEILVIDQTPEHEVATAEMLESLDAAGSIRWIKRDQPSIPQAMNHGLLAARGGIVLFVDDDILLEGNFIGAHREAHMLHGDILVAGRVIQPWEVGRDFSGDPHFHFAALKPAWIREFMGGNFSVRRDSALALGGFDENFVRVAYRFEAEFAHRFLASGKRIYFNPEACLHHLKEVAGGTRTFGEHLTTWRPDHAVGAYYFALRTKSNGRWLKDFISRPFAAVLTRHHLRRPWWIPMTFVSELRGMLWAIRLALLGPRYAKKADQHD